MSYSRFSTLPDVRKTIEGRLIAYCKASDIGLALENASFIKDIKKPYLQMVLLSSETINADMRAKREREYGFFQINICIEQGTGAGRAEAIFQDLKDLFPVVPKMEHLSIEAPPKKSPGFNTEDGFYVIPITFYYRQERN